MKKENTNNTTNTNETNTAVQENASEVVTYEIQAMNGKQETLTFYNATLIKHTQEIQKFREAGNLAMLAIAHIFDTMDKDESYKTAGFKTVAEYGRVVFDYKPATVSLYLRSARAFLTEDENGVVAYVKGIPKLSVGQMIELLPLVKDGTDVSAVIQGFVDGKINDRMSTKAMRDGVNSIRAIDGKVTSEKEADKKEKSDMEKAAKLGDYDGKDSLKKGTSSLDYARQNVDATLEAMENVAKAIVDVEDLGDTVTAKCDEIMKKLMELRAELNK